VAAAGGAGRSRAAAEDASPKLLPAHYTGFVASDNAFYKPIRDAGLATGKLLPQ
jgi:phosphonate transport system substrate-binding protein